MHPKMFKIFVSFQVFYFNTLISYLYDISEGCMCKNAFQTVTALNFSYFMLLHRTKEQIGNWHEGFLSEFHRVYSLTVINFSECCNHQIWHIRLLFIGNDNFGGTNSARFAASFVMAFCVPKCYLFSRISNIIVFWLRMIN